MGTLFRSATTEYTATRPALPISAQPAGRLLVSAVPGAPRAVVLLSPSADRLLLRQSRVPALQPASYSQPTSHPSRRPGAALAHTRLPEPVRADAGRSLCHEPPSAAGARRRTAVSHSHQCAARLRCRHPSACPGFVSPRRRGAGTLHASGCAVGDPALCFHAVASRPTLA